MPPNRQVETLPSKIANSPNVGEQKSSPSHLKEKTYIYESWVEFNPTNPQKKVSPPPGSFNPGTGWLVSLLRPDFVILMNVWWRCSGETTMVMVASQDGSAPFATWMVRLSKRWKAFCQARCATVENCNDSCWWKFGRVEMMSLKCFLCKNCLTRVYLLMLNRRH